jgi:hypothetical protein
MRYVCTSLLVHREEDVARALLVLPAGPWEEGKECFRERRVVGQITGWIF